MIEYHIRLQSAGIVDSAENDYFINQLLTMLNKCDHYKSIRRIEKNDLCISFTKDGNLLVTLDLLIYKPKNKLRILDKLLAAINQLDMILLSFT